MRAEKGFSSLVLVLVAALLLGSVAFIGISSINFNTAASPASDERVQNISFSISFEEPQFKTVEGYDLIEVSGCGPFASSPGAPTVPKKTVTILLPPGGDVSSISVTPVGSRPIEKEVYLYPGQRPVPISDESEPEFTPPDPEFYESPNPYPGELHGPQPLGIQSMSILPKLYQLDFVTSYRGYRIAILTLFPLIYTPAERSAIFHPQLDVEVEVGEVEETLAFRPTPDVEEWVANNVVNPELMSTYESTGESTASSPQVVSLSGAGDDDAEYLIITRHYFWYDDFYEPLRELYLLKSERMSVDMMTVDYITEIYPGGDIPEQIRNCIRDYYENHGTRWVLLAGDADPDDRGVNNPTLDKDWEVPVRYVIDRVPTDYYYAGLDGTWDDDGDGIFGEYREVDWFADVYVGRFPARDSQTMLDIVSKTVAYERNPKTYSENVLLFGAELFPPYNGDIVKKHIKNTYIPADVPVYQYYYGCHADGPCTYDSFVDAVNTHDPVLINAAAHGLWDGLYIMKSGGKFVDWNTPDHITNKGFLMYAMACFTNYFDREGPTLGEKLLWDPDGGAVGYIGATRSSYGSNDPTFFAPGQDSKFFEEFFWGNEYRQGATLYKSKISYILSNYSTFPLDQDAHNLFCYMLLGDPELSILPSQEYGVSISVAHERTGWPGETLDYTVVVMNNGTNDDVYDLIATDELGWTLSFVDNPLAVPAGEIKTTTLSVTLPTDVDEVTDDRITIVATSQASGEWDNASCTAWLGFHRIVGVSISPSRQSDLPRATLNYTVTVTNEGYVEDTYDLTVSDDAGWGPSVSPTSLTLGAGDSGNATLSVTIPSGAASGTDDWIIVRARSRTYYHVRDSDGCIVDVATVRGVDISIPTSYQRGMPGSTLTYDVTVTNTGNISDTYDLTVSDNAGWGPSVSPTSLTLGAGASGNATLSVTIPPGAILGTEDIITVTATSQENTDVSDSASCIARAINVSVDISPIKNDALPGENVSFTVTVTNIKDIEDTYDLIVSDAQGWIPEESLVFYSTASDGYIDSGEWVNYEDAHDRTTGSVHDDSSSMMIGQYKTGPYYFIFRGFVFFDTSGIPDDAIITSATLSVYHYQGEAIEYMVIQNGQPTYPHDPLEAGDYYYANYSVNGGSVGIWDYPLQWLYIELNSTGLSWINKTETTKLALRFSKDKDNNAPTDSEYIVVYASEKGPGYKPKLTVTFYRAISPPSLTIPPGESRQATLTITIPEDAVPGTDDTVTVTARSRADPSVSDSASCIAQVTIVRDVEVSISPSQQGNMPGATLEYTVTVTNEGNAGDMYTLTASDNAGWGPRIEPTSLSLEAGASGTATLAVTIPEDALWGTEDNVGVMATSTSNPSVSANATCVARAGWVGIRPTYQGGLPGATLTYTITVMNMGTLGDTYSLETMDTRNWLLSLDDTSLAVPAGENRTTTLSVTIPSVEIGTLDRITVTVTGTGTDISDDAMCFAQVGKATIGLENLYKISIDFNLLLREDADKLVAKFYTLGDDYQGESVVWENMPWHLTDKIEVPHPQGFVAVENVWLVFVDEAGAEIATVDTFTVLRTDLMDRNAYIDMEWPYVSPEGRMALMPEIADIDMQWPYAPW